MSIFYHSVFMCTCVKSINERLDGGKGYADGCGAEYKGIGGGSGVGLSREKYCSKWEEDCRCY